MRRSGKADRDGSVIVRSDSDVGAPLAVDRHRHAPQAALSNEEAFRSTDASERKGHHPGVPPTLDESASTKAAPVIPAAMPKTAPPDAP